MKNSLFEFNRQAPSLKHASGLIFTGLGGLGLGVYLFWALGYIVLTQFPRERIEINVYPDSLAVNGLYTYANPWPIPLTQGLKTPFPVDAHHPRPATAQISQVIGREEIPLKTWWVQGEPHFSVQIPAYAEIQVRVRYQQAALNNQGSYILTTTQAWKRPLDYGEYMVYPQGVKITTSNYPLNNLRFERRQFMPQQDWHLAWQTAHE